jgi:hypothetical protein
MKRIAFANISLIIDFSSKEEAEQYKKDNFDKGWWFGEIEYNSPIGMWTMEVRKPYGKYNCGW